MATNPQEAFKTHSNYLRAFDTIMGAHYLPTTPPIFRESRDVLAALASSVRASLAFEYPRAQNPSADIGGVRGILRNAWGTEFLLASASELRDDELLGVANNWAVVQAYYACYHAIQAVLVAARQQRPQTHPSTLRRFSDYWTRRRVCQPPWSLGFASAACINLPAGRGVRQIHPWTHCDDETCWDLVAKALRTTRQERLVEAIRKFRSRLQSDKRREWHAQEERRLAMGRRPRTLPGWWSSLPRLPMADRRSVDADTSPTTLLDYLCRLRLRSNYEDPTMFTEGPESPSESREVHGSLCRITEATLLVHELHVAHYIGQQQLGSLADEWLSTPGLAGRTLGLSARQHILLGEQPNHAEGGTP